MPAGDSCGWRRQPLRPGQVPVMGVPLGTAPRTKRPGRWMLGVQDHRRRMAHRPWSDTRDTARTLSSESFQKGVALCCHRRNTQNAEPDAAGRPRQVPDGHGRACCRTPVVHSRRASVSKPSSHRRSTTAVRRWASFRAWASSSSWVGTGHGSQENRPTDTGKKSLSGRRLYTRG